MPTPKPNEKQSDYISRCIPMVINEGTAKDQKQAAAICYSMWRQHKEKSDLTEFSFTIRSVGLNKATGERYWKASTSDIFPDDYNDEMTLDLYNSFIENIKSGVKPPEKYRSEAWDGGMPYVSVAHFREHSIAGDTEKVYVDGAVLKANGTFRDNPIGKACFEALCDDLYSKKSEGQDRIRVSIAFLDYKHQHKSSGFLFERSEANWICPECLKEQIEGKSEGKKFLDGLLVHFAMTRVPVNKRTLMEVEKSMTTRKEDAASIVGEQLAEEMSEKEQELTGKSEALVIKSEEVPIVEKTSDMDEDDAGKDKKKKMMKGKKKKEHMMDGTEQMSDAEDEETEEESDPILEKIDELEKALDNILSKIETITKPEPSTVVSQSSATVPHPLDAVITQLRSDFDSVSMMDATTEERLQSIQTSFNLLGETIRSLLTVEQKSAPAQTNQESALMGVLQKLSDKLDLLAAQQPQQRSQPSSIPAPRSINPANVPQIGTQQHQPVPNGPTPHLRSLIDKSVGL